MSSQQHSAEELGKLDNKTLNVMLAEQLGWKWTNYNGRLNLWHPEFFAQNPKSTVNPEDFPSHERLAAPPRYCSDLNAVAEVERTLQGEQRNTYASHILAAFEPVETDFDLVTATARQRTIALILTLNP